MEQNRKHTRETVPAELVGDFAFWLADGLDPRQSFDLSDLGPPQIELGVRRHFSLLLHDLSAGGVGLTIHSNLFQEVKLEPFLGHKLLARFKLLNNEGKAAVSLVLLCEVRHEALFLNRLETGLKFLAWSQMTSKTGEVRLRQVDEKGVPGLEDWRRRFAKNEGE